MGIMITRNCFYQILS